MADTPDPPREGVTRTGPSGGPGPGSPAGSFGPGDTFGSYKILELIGEGGFGTVYKAEQRRPVRRIVALKVIKPGVDTKEVIARFNSERQALARMDHPHIAKVLDVGSTDAGRPYFVMEYVPGVPITKYADDNKLTLEQRLNLFIRVCDAIAHAHQKAIIHRDIKASNILAYTHDDKPDVKVIDFGIAKALTSDRLTELTFNTAQGMAIGTYATMSPEQADGSPDIDTRSDVYSLGVLLYELLTGVKPFDPRELAKSADDEVRRIIREVDPPTPSTKLTALTPAESAKLAKARQLQLRDLRRRLKSELEWIPLKALRKERDRRYDSAEQMGVDVGRYLAGKPLIAGPESRAYRTQKFVKRNRAALTIAAVLLLTLVVGMGGTLWGLGQARVQARAARLAEAEAVAQRNAAQQEALKRAEAEAEAVMRQREAERQARVAARSAAVSSARHNIQQDDLPAAIKEMGRLAGTELTASERLVHDEIYRAARLQWELESVIATDQRARLACIGNEHEGGHWLVVASGERLLGWDAYEPDRSSSVLVGFEPKGLIHVPGSDTVVAWGSRGRISSFRIRDGKLEVQANEQLPGKIRRVAAGRERIFLLGETGRAELRDRTTLEVTHRWPDNAIPAALNSVATTCHLSPTDDLVLLHRGEADMPLYALREDDPKVVELGDFRVGLMTFAQRLSPTSEFLSWYSPSGDAGLSEELKHYSIEVSSLGHEEVAYHRITGIDLKRRLAINFNKSMGRAVLFGEAGVTRKYFSDDNTDPPSTPYTSLWPFESGGRPEYLASCEHGTLLALGTERQIILLGYNSDSGGGSTFEDYNSFATEAGTITLEDFNDQQSVIVTYTPFDPTAEESVLALQWIESQGSTYFPWLFHVTPDGGHAIVCAQETNGSNTDSSTYLKKIALLYRIEPGANGVPRWELIKQVEMPHMYGRHGNLNHALRLSPDASVFLFLTSEGEALRYSTQTGELLSTQVLGDRAETSRDGRYYMGRLVGEAYPSVYEVASGERVCTLTQTRDYRGGAFASDAEVVVVSDGGGEIQGYAIPSGRRLWSIDSVLIPRAWAEGGGEFLAMTRLSGTREDVMVLGDKATGREVGLLNKTALRQFDASVHPELGIVQFQVSRRRNRVVRLVDHDGLAKLLSQPRRSAVYSEQPLPEPVEATTTLHGGQQLKTADIEALETSIGQVVTVEADVVRTSWTLRKDGLNLEFAGGKTVDDGLMVWIDPGMVRAINQAGTMKLDPTNPFPWGYRVRVTGPLGPYGGHAERWKHRLQITLDDPSKIEIVEVSEEEE